MKRDAAAEASFWDRVQKVAGCWIWTGTLVGAGYGQVRLRAAVDPQRRRLGAHRYAYELAVGPIPPGLEVHHSCENPACVNPSHLTLATHAENCRGLRDPTKCRRGHSLTGANLYVAPTGERRCRACNAANMRRLSARRKAQREATG